MDKTGPFQTYENETDAASWTEPIDIGRFMPGRSPKAKDGRSAPGQRHVVAVNYFGAPGRSEDMRDVARLATADSLGVQRS